MKKLVSIMVLVLCALAISAQEKESHLAFMGIELNGKISEFQTKLLAKGLTVSPQSKEMPNGMRLYDGIFSGEKAEIAVWYNPRTQKVYRAKAMINRYGKDMIEQLMSKMISKLDVKYGTDVKSVNKVEDDHMHKFEQSKYSFSNGFIGVFVVSKGYSDQSEFTLHVDYTDRENYLENTKDEMDDL